MAKLKEMYIQVNANDGLPYRIGFPLVVDDDGRFTATILDEYSGLIQLCQSNGTGRVAVWKARKYWKVSSSNLHNIKDYLRERMKDLYTFEIKVTTVIKYSFMSRYALCQDKTNGELHPNGAFIEGMGNYEWLGNLNANKQVSGGYSVGLYAALFTKTEYIYPSNTESRVEYKPYKGTKGSFGELLSGFVGCTEPNTATTFDDKILEIDYTEEVAEFFYNSMMGIAKIANTLTDKFSNNESVLKMAESKQKLLSNE